MSQAAAPANPRTIAVASGKGGVGKTWLSITLSHALARRHENVLLFDGDLGMANVDIQLGTMPARDLVTVLEGTSTLKGAVQRSEAAGFDIIAGRSGSGSISSLSQLRVAELSDELAALTDAYDRVVIDLGAGIERSIRQLALRADMILVVTTEEPTALTDAYAFIKVIHGAKPSADIRVVVNMAHSQREGERTFDTISRACHSFLKMTPTFAGVVRRDRHVRDAIRAQSPLLVRSPNADAAQDVEAIAATLAGR